MSEETNNIQNNTEETQLTELEKKFCDLYVNGGVGLSASRYCLHLQQIPIRCLS